MARKPATHSSAAPLMQSIGDYNLIEEIDEGFRSTFYRARKTGETDTVILQLIDASRALPSEIARAKYAFEKIKALEDPHILRIHEVFEYENFIAVVTEAFPSRPFYTAFPPGKLKMDTFLELAETLARSLGYIHGRGILHHSLTPNSVRCNATPDRIKLTGFGATHLITRLYEEIYDPHVIQSHLPYMAPEQTGRMNCSVDHRADLYSLGVLLYELLTGGPPFASDDPMEIIHAHIALQPLAPERKNPVVPNAVSNIVMRLLTKTAENRYQSAYGAAADLAECIQQLKTKGEIRQFDLGRRDIPSGLHIPEKLFGRETEIEILMAAFDRCSGGGNELLMVAGRPGIGKSTLINEIQKPVVARRAYFITGKAEQYKQDIPYFLIIQALEDLARRVLCEPDERIDAWKTDILSAMGTGSRLIIDLVSDFKHIIGPQPNLAPISGGVAHHQIAYIFKEFLKVCATETHPMVIFADDLQWADAASLNLIQMLSTEPEIQYLLIIGAFRDNAVDDAHPLLHTLSEAKKKGARINTITLPPLSAANVHQMLTDLLRSDSPAAFALSDLVHRKTNGNPFFIRQFLKAIHDKKALILDPESGWRFHLEGIENIQATDNVMDFMAARISAMPPATLEALKICACYGNRFNLESVAVIRGNGIDATYAQCAPAIDEGLIVFKGNAGMFSHDRIREGVYGLLTEPEGVQIHYRIGQYLLENTPEERLDENITDIVNQFNIARELITSVDELKQAARLNCRAGEKAVRSGAFEAAFYYFNTGIALITAATAERTDPEAYWKTDYELALALYNGCSQAAYLVGDYEEMRRLTEIIFDHAKTIHDPVLAHTTRLHTLMAENRLEEVIGSGLSVLRFLGVTLPKKPAKRHVLAELIRTKLYIMGKKPQDFLKLPMTEDPDISRRIAVMAVITATAYWTAPNLLPIIAFRLVRAFARHGNTEYAPYIYAGYGFILCTLGDMDTGYAYGQMAAELMDRIPPQKYRGRTLMVINTFIRHWKEHAAKALDPLMEAFHMGMAHGDIEFAGHSLMASADARYLTATPLPTLDTQLQEYIKRLSRIGQVSNLHVVRIDHQAVLNLAGKNETLDTLIGESYDETLMLPVHEQAKDRIALVHLYVNKLLIHLVFENTEKAYFLAEKVMRIIEGRIGSLFYAFAFFYVSLARVRYLARAGRMRKTKILRQVAQQMKKLKEWADHAPENFRHMYLLVKAETARAKGQDTNAVAFYKKAVSAAEKTGYMQHAALACEYLAGFYADQGIEDFAASYMARAVELYRRWGAHAKVRQLAKKHERLLKPLPETREPAQNQIQALPFALPRGMDRLDIAALMKMSQAISSEIQLDRLLVILMRVIMENSGAETALLILNRDGWLVVEARARTNLEGIEVLQALPVNQCPDLCLGILNYVKRKGTPLVLDDAQTSDQFAQDPYIQNKRVRSLLCLPLIQQQRTIGLIYLENNLTPNAFTPEGTEMIMLLSTQAANCLENAILFEATRAAEKQAQEQQERYQRLVETMNDGLAIIDPQLHVTYVNPALCRMSHYRADQLIGRPAIDFLDEKNQQKLEYEVTHWTDLERHVFEIDWIAKNGKTFTTIVSPNPVYDEKGEFAGFLGILTDVTNLKKAEKEKDLAQAQLLQAQKLEAIGTLAGGVAHDFNNYLTTILGSVDLINMKNDIPENLKKHIAHIQHAAELSAALTRQLLAFGRVQRLKMTAIDLNAVISNIEMMLRRLIGENITLTTRLTPNLKRIRADFGQMEQIIINLAVNARDAMPDGGELYLKTTNVKIDQAWARQHKNAVCGEFVCLSVEDTGSGMDPETVDKIFDPFFSSKAPDKGTGLGLSMVYGVVKQHQGWINVYSEPNQGSRFHIYLPVLPDAADQKPADLSKEEKRKPEIYAGRQQRILLIEDQKEVREVVKTALTENGYIVREVSTLAEAEAVMDDEGWGFELLFSDVVLPDGNGIDFAGQVIRRKPAVKVLLSSGYSEEKTHPDTIAQQHFHFLQKPYPLSRMLETVHGILLDQPP